MGWFLEAFANVVLEVLGDLMSWAVYLVSYLALDIGMDSTVNADGTRTPVTPEIGSIIDPTKAHGNLLEETFPSAVHFTTLFFALGLALIIFMMLMKLLAGFGGPFVKNSSTSGIFFRSILAAFLTTYSYSIFVLFESVFNGIYGEFVKKYRSVTKGAEKYAKLIADDPTLSYSERFGGADDAFSMFGKDLIEDYKFGQGLALSLISIVLFTILLIAFMKLLLEIYERYLMIGVLYYMAPLACSTLVSKEMDVFTNWLKMVISEFVVMCSNLFFTGVFISAWTNILNTKNHALFADPRDYVTKMFLLIGWLIIGQQIDQHIKDMGLSTAQTGKGLGGSIAAAAGTAVVATRTGIGAAKTAFHAAESGASAVASLTGRGSSFNENSTSQSAANEMFSAIKEGGLSAAGLGGMSGEKQGAVLTNAVAQSMGTTNFEKAISSQAPNQGIGNILPSTASFDPNTGVYKAMTQSGQQIALQNGSFDKPYHGVAAGNGWSIPQTEDQRKQFAADHASNMRAEYRGEKIQGWAASYTGLDSNGEKAEMHAPNYSSVFAIGKDGTALGQTPIPNLIEGRGYMQERTYDSNGAYDVESKLR